MEAMTRVGSQRHSKKIVVVKQAALVRPNYDLQANVTLWYTAV
jgi:hypothetical protein